jgi:hypothetical protein
MRIDLRYLRRAPSSWTAKAAPRVSVAQDRSELRGALPCADQKTVYTAHDWVVPSRLSSNVHHIVLGSTIHTPRIVAIYVNDAELVRSTLRTNQMVVSPLSAIKELRLQRGWS